MLSLSEARALIFLLKRHDHKQSTNKIKNLYSNASMSRTNPQNYQDWTCAYEHKKIKRFQRQQSNSLNNYRQSFKCKGIRA